MSHKYQLDQFLTTTIIPRLKQVFMTELELWDEWDGFSGFPPLEIKDHHAIEALNLFRLLNRPEMIPRVREECERERD